MALELRKVTFQINEHRLKLGSHSGERTYYWVSHIGYFHVWGIETDGDGNADTVGIIEDLNGKIYSAIPTRIVFVEPARVESISLKEQNKKLKEALNFIKKEFRYNKENPVHKDDEDQGDVCARIAHEVLFETREVK